MNAEAKSDSRADSRRRKRWRRLKRLAVVLFAVSLAGVILLWDPVRSLISVRRVGDTNAFVMDYYVDYHLDEIEAHGMDVRNIEDSCINTLIPAVFLPVAHWVKRSFIPEKIETTDQAGHHCSCLFLESSDGTCYFARNQDYSNDAFLILRIHDDQGLASIALIDLAYLNLDRADLDETSLIQRLPLLFAPYYACDGVNRHGVAVGIMSVDDQPVVAGHDPSRPDVINTTLMRIILDNARSAEEAVAIANRYNVHFVERSQHVLIGDASGRSVVLEHIDGEIHLVETQSAWQVCTNHQLYKVSEQASDEQCQRYRTGSAAAEQLGHSFDRSDVEKVIRSMSVESWTMWTCIYNLSTGEVSVGYKQRTDGLYHDRIPTKQ